VLELKLVNAKGRIQACPRLTFLEGQPAVVDVGKCVALVDGSVEDLVSQANYVRPDNAVRLGCSFRVKATGLGQDRVRVDLSVRRSEVASASQSDIIVSTSCLRAIKQVKLGNVVRLTLDKNDQGTPGARVEFKVTAAKD
jgi:hypothetical protein